MSDRMLLLNLFLFYLSFFFLVVFFFQIVASEAAGQLHRDGDVEAERQRCGPRPCPGGRIGQEVLGS